jgi:heme oxygenase
LARLTVEAARANDFVDDVLFGPLEFATADTYRRFLCMLYGFQAPLEAAIAMTPGIDLQFVDARMKTRHIARDLMALGLTRREFQMLSRRQTIEPFENPAVALGWMYSTERLMPHVDVLRTQLECELPIVFALANGFMSTYEYVTELRWRQYGSMIDRVAKKYGAPTIIAAAHAGLASLQDWLAEHTAAREAA